MAKHTCISYILICKDLLTVDSCKKLLAKLLVARLAEKSEHVLLVALNTWLVEWIYTKCVSTYTTCELKCVEQLTESELINLVDVDLMIGIPPSACARIVPFIALLFAKSTVFPAR